MRAAVRAESSETSPLSLVLTVSDGRTHQGLGNMLQTLGFRVSFLSDGSAMTAAMADLPKLVILDLAAPPSDAIGLLNRLSLASPGPQTVLLGAGASHAGMGVVEFDQTVAFGWLTKAWHVDDLAELEQRLRSQASPPDITKDAVVKALDRHEFTLHYQPIFDISQADPKLVSVEALVRWAHPKLGLLLPGDFLALVISEGLMPRLTDLTLQLAAEQLTAWKQRKLRLPIAVNIGADMLTDPQFPKRLLRVLEELHIGPEDLILEVAEHGVMSQRPEPVGVAAELIDRGFRLVLDDFGSGPISLMQVMTLHFSAIKIDECLIRQVSRNERAKQLARGVVRMAHDLGMRVCGESVETAETLLSLKDLECDEAQGWYLGRPLPASELSTGMNSASC